MVFNLVHHLQELQSSGIALPEGAAWDAFLNTVARAHAEEEAALQRYHLVEDHLQEVVFQVDRDGLWSFLNRAWADLTGHAVSESLGKPFLGFLHPVDKARYLNMVTHATESGEHVVSGELRINTASGEVRWVQMYNRITRDGEGTVVGVTGTLADITERKRYEAQLATLNTHLLTLIDNMQAGILVETERGQVALLNEVFCRLFEIPVPAQMLIQSDALELFDMCLLRLKEPEEARERLRAMLEGQELITSQEFLLADGRVFSLDFIPIPATQGFRGHFWQVHDITDRKRADEALQEYAEQLAEARDRALHLSQLKSDFLANMSHEIRTPMNGIIGMTGLLLEGSLTSEQRDYAETVRNSAESLLRLINDILDFSKIEAGKLTLEHIEFAPLELIEDLFAVASVKAAAKHVELLLNIGPNVPMKVKGDPVRFRQILTNLVDNGIKFTTDGSVDVRMTVAETGPEGVLLKLEVTDSGIGMAPEVVANLFQSFYQGDSSTTRQYGGTGLGLAICRHLSRLMGGEIGVSSQHGVGSTFWFTLRLEPTGPAMPSLPAEAPRQVVLAGLSPWLYRNLRMQLAAWGRDVSHVDRLEELAEPGRVAPGAKVLVQAPPGTQARRELEGLLGDPALRSRVVMLLPLQATQERLEAARIGIPEFLTLPVRLTQLRALFEPAQPQPVVAASPSGGPAFSQDLRLLLVEDNAVNQKVALTMLKKLGLVADLASGGEEAVAAVAARRYDLVLMDCQMPGMDGFEATRKIREGQVGMARVPIVAMTANAMQGDRERCLDSGMDDYISKPVTLAVLKAALERWLNRD